MIRVKIATTMDLYLLSGTMSYKPISRNLQAKRLDVEIVCLT